jgi:hypothetical protein
LKWQNIDADDLPAAVNKSFDAMVDVDQRQGRKWFPRGNHFLGAARRHANIRRKLNRSGIAQARRAG